MKRLPIGIEDFEKIRQEDYYYVDKTLGILSEMAQRRHCLQDHADLVNH